MRLSLSLAVVLLPLLVSCVPVSLPEVMAGVDGEVVVPEMKEGVPDLMMGGEGMEPSVEEGGLPMPLAQRGDRRDDDCRWSDWSACGNCDNRGNGERTRNGNCQGIAARLTDKCTCSGGNNGGNNDRDCRWSPWSACERCDRDRRGQRTRTGTCNGRPSAEGEACTCSGGNNGGGNNNDDRDCRWSDWSACGNCRNGRGTRTRDGRCPGGLKRDTDDCSCSGGNNGGNNNDDRDCRWSDWSPCGNCRNGRGERTRTGRCPGGLKRDTDDCFCSGGGNNGGGDNCCQRWSSWSQWSDCCERSQNRRRSCLSDGCRLIDTDTRRCSDNERCRRN